MAVSRRDPAIDVIRGIAILSMVIAHTAINSPLYVVSHGALWFDAATGFVLLAGLVIGLVQTRAAATRDGLAKIGKRARLVWAAHVSLAVLALCVAPWDRQEPVSPPPADHLGGWPSAVAQALTLRINPMNVDILSMYVLLFGVAAVGVLLLRRGLPKTFLCLSGAVYVAGALFPATGTLPEYPGAESYFNVATWQALFAISLVVGWYWRSKRLDEWFNQRHVAMTAGATALALCALAQPIERLRILDRWPAVDQLVRDTFAKDSIGPGRILVGWCVFAVLYYLLRGDRLGWAKRWATSLFNRVGQRSLDAFVILSVFVILLPVAVPYEPASIVGMGWAVLVFSVIWLWAKARESVDRRRSGTGVPRDNLPVMA